MDFYYTSTLEIYDESNRLDDPEEGTEEEEDTDELEDIKAALFEGVSDDGSEYDPVALFETRFLSGDPQFDEF